MRKAFYLILIIAVLAAGGVVVSSREEAAQIEGIARPSPTTTQTIGTEPPVEERSVFIPYWDIPEEAVSLYSYDRLFYFGIAPQEDGSVLEDTGLKGIQSFLSNTPSGKKRYLTVRMVNTTVNTAILDDRTAQERIIRETQEYVQAYEFDGVVLDLELSVLPFSGTKEDITGFIRDFARMTQSADKEFLVTLYGDTFYRGRPYDVEKIAAVADEVLIMTYDFHKRRGEPGPNFPFDRQSIEEDSPDYPYSFKEMISDFQDVVPSEKLTILFGMYGYDWTLGPQGLPLKAAKAIPLYQIEEGYKDCERIVIPDSIRNPEKLTGSAVEDDGCYELVHETSREKVIHYTDDEGYSHQLWYEDDESVQVKTEYLKEQGIGSVGYWVWGYF